MPLYIRSVATAVPEVGIDQADAAEIARALGCPLPDQQRLLPALYRRAGVRRRHSVILDSAEGALQLRQQFYPPAKNADDRGPTTAARMERYEADAGKLAAAAARRALANAGVAADEVAHLLTVSCSGCCAPGFDVTLVRDLPLLSGVTRTHLGFMGCHGALNALRVAQAFAVSEPESYTLICCVELCSLHHQYGWDPDRVVANALFADGAAAIVCGGRPGDSRDAPFVEHSGSTIVPETLDAMGWRIGDHGFEMTLSPRVPELIHRHLRPWLDGWLRRSGIALDQVGSWAIHPGGPRILSACAEALELDREHVADSLAVLAEFGNMSSPTVLFILDRLLRRNAASPCVMLGFGPGLTIEAALVRW
ncbi:MAG TPA: type III polyketide synthase [Planctomycetaceae bacterium]|jgi:predicted naringenin-chalcone synthase|nr:type III polyketide synthase [Planctomycetaceae bacterium]